MNENEDVVKNAEEIIRASGEEIISEKHVNKTIKTIDFMLKEYGDILSTRGIIEILIPFEIKDEELSRIKIKYNDPLEIRYTTMWNPYEKISSGLIKLINPNIKPLK